MEERLEGTLKITQGWLKRAVGLTPLTLAVAGCILSLVFPAVAFVKRDSIVEQYQQKQSYVEHIAGEKEKLLQEFSAGMSWQEYNKKINELESQDYAIEYLQATDEEFAKDYKLVENLTNATWVGLGSFLVAGIASGFQGAFLIGGGYDAFWFESAKDDIDEGKDLLKEAKLARTTLPPDERDFESIEDEYK